MSSATEYAKCVQLLTGFNPDADPAFQRSVANECVACDVTTETYVVSIDGEVFERLCWPCFLATNDGKRSPGETPVVA